MESKVYRQELWQLLRLAIPLVLAQVAQNAMSFIDTVMVGQLGKDALAGIALGSTFFFLVIVVLGGVILAVGPLVSQATGAERPQDAARALRQGMWLGVIAFVPAFMFFRHTEGLFLWLGQEPEIARASSQYLRAISWGLLPAFWTFALRGFLEGHSDTKPIMVISFLGVLLNIGMNYGLIFGHYGLPPLGLVGAAYATVFVYFFICVLSAVYVEWRFRHLEIFTHVRRPDLEMLWELVRVGGPIAMTLAFEVGLFSASALVMGTLGANALAAHQIVLQTASITFMVPLGIAIAASVRVGQAAGRQSMGDARLSGYVGILSCASVMCVSAVIFWTAPERLIGFFVDTDGPQAQEVVALAAGFFSFAAMFQVFDGVQVAASSALRGIKDTKAAMLLTLCAYWLIGFPLGALLCFSYGLGGNGLWSGLVAGLLSAAILLTARFQQLTSGGRNLEQAITQ